MSTPHDATNPYVFIVGCPRSGTTLVRRLVDAHPAIAVTRETHWITKWLARGAGIASDGTTRREILESLFAYERFARMPIARGDLEALFEPGEALPYAAFVTRIFDLYGRAFGKQLVGDKTPGYVRTIPTLHALWPWARFVHVLRDGRDVALSAVSSQRSSKLAHRFSTWTDEPYATAAVWWEWLVRLGREAGAALGPSLYYELRYERLVGDPAGACAALCNFLGLPYDDAMLRFHEGRTKHDPTLNAKKAWLPVTPGLRDWRSQMPREDVECFEAAAGDLIDTLGYPRSVPRPGATAVRVASVVRESFLRDIAERAEPVPRAWAA